IHQAISLVDHKDLQTRVSPGGLERDGGGPLLPRRGAGGPCEELACGEQAHHQCQRRRARQKLVCSDSSLHGRSPEAKIHPFAFFIHVPHKRFLSSSSNMVFMQVPSTACSACPGSPPDVGAARTTGRQPCP